MNFSQIITKLKQDFQYLYMNKLTNVFGKTNKKFASSIISSCNSTSYDFSSWALEEKST